MTETKLGNSIADAYALGYQAGERRIAELEAALREIAKRNNVYQGESYKIAMRALKTVPPARPKQED